MAGNTKQSSKGSLTETGQTNSSQTGLLTGAGKVDGSTDTFWKTEQADSS